MACKYTYKGTTYNSKEEFINQVINPQFLSIQKVRRVMEVQSDLFQKWRNNFEFENNKYTAKKDDKNVWHYYKNGTEINANEYTKTWETFLDTYLDNADAFTKLLQKDNNWVTFFVKSIIQDSAKKGYEKVLFPSGNTASKVEGHTTLEEFKKQTEGRIKELENQKFRLDNTWLVRDMFDVFGENDKEFTNEEEAQKYANENSTQSNILTVSKIKSDQERVNTEITQLKQELERVETEGFGALKPIYNFYENTVTNILNKTYGKENVKVITDEFGNTWNELTLEESRDLKSLTLNRTAIAENNTNVSTEEINWFNSRLNLNGTRLNISATINSNVFGTWTRAGVTLYANAASGTLYHEAWHEFSQMYLLDTQINRLYNEALGKLNKKDRDIYNSLNDHDKSLFLEEFIAEDFRGFMQTGKSSLIKENKSLFEKIKAFLNKLFGDITIEKAYADLKNGNLNSYTKSSSSFFGALNRSAYLFDDLGQDSDKIVNSLFDHIDIKYTEYAMANNVDLNDKEAVKIFNSKVFPKIYKDLSNYYTIFGEKLDKWGLAHKVYNSILNNKVQTDNGEVSNYQVLMSEYLEERNIKNIEKSEEDEDNVNDAGEEIVEELEKVRNSFENTNENDSYADASIALRSLLENIPKVTPSGDKHVIQLNSFGFMDKADTIQLWKVMLNNLAGLTDINVMIDKLQSLSTDNPSLLTVIHYLGGKNPSKLTLQATIKRSDFYHTFSNTLVPREVSLYDSKKGSISLKRANNKSEERLFDSWKTNFEDSPYAFKGVNGVKFLFKDFLADFPFYSIEITDEMFSKPTFKPVINEIKAKRVEFLKALGIDLSEDAVKSGEFDLILKNYQSEGNFDIIHDIHRWITTMISNNNPINNVIGDMLEYSSFKDLKGQAIIGRKKDLKRLGEIELKYSSTFFEPSIYNAADKPEYEHQLNNYMTLFSNTLNNPEYETLNEIFALPEYNHLNPDANPMLLDSLVINRLFTKNTEGIWERNKENGKNVTYSLISYNGLDILKVASENLNEKGQVTTKLAAFDKLSMDILNALSIGVQENIRTGDKSSAYAFKMSSWGKDNSGKKLNTPISLEEASVISLRNINSSHIAGGTFMRDLLLSEIKRIKIAKTTKLNSKIYDKKATTFVIFDALLSNGVKADLQSLIDSASSPDHAVLLAKEYILGPKGERIKDSITTYFLGKNGTAVAMEKALLDGGLSLLAYEGEDGKMVEGISGLFGSIKYRDGKSLTIKEIAHAYSTISFILNAENMRVLYGDLAFYKDPFKRFSGFSATGTMARTDDEMLRFLRNNPNTLLQSRNYMYENDLLDEADFQISNEFKVAVFKDVRNVSQFYETIRAGIKNQKLKEGFSEEAAEEYVDKLDVLELYRGKALEEGHEGYEEPDATAVCTLEWYLAASLRTDSWSEKQENAFVKIITGEALSNEEIALFPVRKDQYTGGIKNSLGLFVPALHKYAIVPLIPSVIAGTPYEKLNNRMLRQRVGYATFASGSKIETLTDENGQINDFYGEDGDFNDKELTTQTIFWKFMKNQVKIAPKMKTENTFGTQYRKLLFQDKFNGGVPVDVKDDNWFNLTLDEKIKLSPIFKLYHEYNTLLQDMVNHEKDGLIKELGIKQINEKSTITNWSNLRDLIKQEIQRRDLPNSVLDTFKTITKKGSKDEVELSVSDLEGAKNKLIVEKILFSIINNRLVNQKVYGDALVQASVTGFEKTYVKERFKNKGYSKDLAFYRIDPNTGETLAMQVKISFDPNKHMALLALEFEGKNFKRETLAESIKDLNAILMAARLDENSKEGKWVEKNKKFLTMVGYRIPTQGLNSIEVMQVVEFLDPSMASTIIVPSEIVVSAGSDFDVDKLNIFQYKISGGIEEGSKPFILTKTFDKNGIKTVFSNRLLDVAVKSLLMPESFEGMVTPNSTNIIKDQIADKIKAAVGARTGEFNLSKSPTLVLDALNILEQFNAFLGGKDTLGIAALANTFTQLYQSSGAYLSNFVDKREVMYFLPHRKVIVDGVEHIDYSHSYTLDDIKKSELFSQFINAYVDIAKEPFIFYMNAGKMMAPVIFHMLQMGTSPIDVANFMNQPIIRDYVKMLNMKESKFLKIAFSRSRNEELSGNFKSFVQDSLVEKYSDSNKGFKGIKNDFLSNYVKYANSSYERISKSLADDLIMPLNFDKNSPSSKRQLIYLAQLDELLFQSGLLRDVTGTLNFDTGKTSNIMSLIDKSQKVTKYSKTDNIFPSVVYNRIKNETPIRAFENFDLLKELFTPLFPLSSNPLVLDTLAKIKLDLTKAGIYGAKSVEKVEKLFYNQLISFIVQNGLIVEGKFVNNIFTKYAKMLSGENNIGTRLNNLQNRFEEVMPNAKETRFINLFSKKESKNSNIVSITYEGDRITGRLANAYEKQFSDLLEFTHPDEKFADDVRTFFKDLIYTNLVENGISKTGTTFNELIPSEEFRNVVRPLIDSFISQITQTQSGTNLFKGFLDHFPALFRQNNGGIFKEISAKGTGNFKEYKLRISNGLFRLSPTIVSKKNAFIEIDPNFSSDLLGGDTVGTLTPATGTFSFYGFTNIKNAAKLSAWQNVEAVSPSAVSYYNVKTRVLSNEQLFIEGKKTALTLPVTITQVKEGDKTIDTLKIEDKSYRVGDVVFFGHSFNKFRITALVDLGKNLNNHDMLTVMAKKEYVNLWYFTQKEVKSSYLNIVGVSGTQVQFEKIVEELDSTFEYMNSYVSTIPGEYYRILEGQKKQLTLGVNRPISVGDTLIIKENNFRNSNMLQIKVTEVSDVNINELFQNSDEFEKYLQLENNQEHAAQAKKERIEVAAAGEGLVKVIKFERLAVEKTNDASQELPAVIQTTKVKSADMTSITVSGAVYNIGTDGKYFTANGKEVTNETILNKIKANLSFLEGTLRESTYNNSKYFILPDNTIIGTGKTNFGKVTISDPQILQKIINSSVTTQKDC